MCPMARHDVALNLSLVTAYLMKYSDPDRDILHIVHARIKWMAVLDPFDCTESRARPWDM